MRWLGLLMLMCFTPVNLDGQSVADFPEIPSVSDITVVDEMLYFNLAGIDPLPPPFQVWWAEMETCTGIHKPFGGIKWFVATAIYDASRHAYLWGLYYFDPPEIILTRNMTRLRLEDTVKHEALHHLLGGTDHATEAFAHCLPSTPER